MIVMIWQPIFKIQDGDRRHLEKYTSGSIAIRRKELLVCYFQLNIQVFLGFSRRLRVVYSREL